MINETKFAYEPSEHEAEKASNSYLMSLVAIIAGLPLPIVNLIASLIFYFGNIRGTYFVRWHCTQALLSQLLLLPINTICFWWTIIAFTSATTVSFAYVFYLTLTLIINLMEFVFTIYTAIQSRKGIHVEWWALSKLTNSICKPSN